MKKFRSLYFATALALVSMAAMAGGLETLFTPQATARLTATTSSSSVTFTDAASIDAESVLISNEGALPIYWAKGIGSATAVAPTGTPNSAATPVLAGAIESFYKGKGISTIAVITSTGTSAVDITAGSGL